MKPTCPKRRIYQCAATVALLTAAYCTRPSPARAQDASLKSPSTRPARSNLREGMGGGGRHGELGGGLNGGGLNGGNPGGGTMNPRRLENFSQEETDSAIEFFIQNSPNRMKYFKQLQENSPQRRFVIQGLMRTYRPIINFKDKNTDLYNLLIQQIKLRDDAFQLAIDSDNGNKEADAKLHAKAAEIIDVTLKARAQRIELLQKELTEQQTQLANDQADPSALVDPELASIRFDKERLLRRVERMGGQHGQSMLPPQPTSDLASELPNDPLATVGPDTPHD